MMMIIMMMIMTTMPTMIMIMDIMVTMIMMKMTAMQQRLLKRDLLMVYTTSCNVTSTLFFELRFLERNKNT